MPLPKDFFDSPIDTTTTYTGGRNIFPDFGEEDVEDKGSAYDAIGGALWSAGAHFISGGTLGLTEFIAPTKAWEEKTTAERVGAAVGEAAGFFVPMAAIGKGVRGVMALGKAGSKRIAKDAIKASVSKVDDAALKTAVGKGLNKGIFSREGKRLLYQHELGGEAVEQINKTLMTHTQAALTKAVKDAGLKELDDATVNTIMKGLQKGLMEGKHINSVSSWIHQYTGPALGSGRVREWMAKYLGEFAQDAVVLGIQGVASNAIHAAARDDMPLTPGSALGHAVLLSAAFPAIRSFGGGGERKMGELWNILRAKNAKTNYSKISDPEDLRGYLQILTGGSKANILKKTEWTAKSGKKYSVNDFEFLNMANKEIVADLRDVAGQIQKSIGKIDGAKLWGKAYLKDTLNPATITRMAVGAAVMNLDMFKDNAAMFRNLPPEEVLTHMLIGAMMSRGKGGWARDPKSRSADATAEELNNYYEVMHLLGIDHSAVSEYVKVKNFRDMVIGHHMGLAEDDTGKEIERIYKKYEKKLKPTVQSEHEINDSIQEWKLLRDSIGLMRDEKYNGFDYRKLSPKDRIDFKNDLLRIVHNDKPLSETSYGKFMHEFSLAQADVSERMHLNFFERLNRESTEGADDRPLNMFIDNNGRINHGGINWENESQEVYELYSLLSVLEKRGLAVKLAQDDFPMVDYSKNPAALRQLERMATEFREEQKQLGFGEGVNYSIHLGNPDSNPFLRTWINSAQLKGQDRIANMATRQNVESMDKGDRDFMATIMTELSDVDGSIVHPTRYRVTSEDKDGKIIESQDPDLQDKIYGLASAFYQGAAKTSLTPKDKNTIDIPEEIAKQLIGSYENLGMPLPAETLFNSQHLDFIESRAYEKFDARPENIRVMQALEENNLAVVEKDEGRILVNSEAAIRELAKDLPKDTIEELVIAHREVVSNLPSKIVQEADGIIEFPLEVGKEVNVESLLAIRKMLPEIFEKEVRAKVYEVMDNRTAVLDDIAINGELDLLTKNLSIMNYDAAFKNLENIQRELPGFDKKFEGIYDAIVKQQEAGLPLELQVFELSKGTGNVYNAIQEYVGSEKMASRRIERYLAELIYKGRSFSSASDYNKLVDVLNTEIGKGTEKVSLHSLFETYLQRNNYESLQKLMAGLNKIYAGRTNPNNLENQHLMDAMEQMFQNQASEQTRNKISIGREYGLLDQYGSLKPLAVERLKNGEFDIIKEKMIPDSKHTDNIDQDLLHLSEIVRNTREQKMIRFTETLTENGESIMVREWIMPWDNAEFNTPSNIALDVLKELGIELIPISKTGIVDGTHQSNISYIRGIKGKYENNTVINMPEDKYLSEQIKKGGQIHPEDELLRRVEMPDGKMRFVEVSLGRPLNFVENNNTLESLNTAFRDWFEIYKLRYTEGSRQRENFERLFDPEKVTDPEVKIRALYSSMLNDVGFDATFTPEAIEMFAESGGHYDLNMKLLKYNKLAEGGSLKALPDANQIELYLNNLADLPADRRVSLENIMNDLRDDSKLIPIAIYADEAPNNPLIVRSRQIDQLNTTIQDPVLRSYLQERYSDTNRFKKTMDVSSIDGGIYIDTDMKNLFLTVMANPDHSNGFKGSIAKSGNTDLINIYSKGLFIFDPAIASAMESKGLRITMGETAAKNFGAMSSTGSPVEGRIAANRLLENDISNISENNILRTTLEGIGVRFGGHLSNNAPVPHPYTHYMPENMVIAVRDGWQMLGDKISEINTFSDAIKRSANEELALAIKKQREDNVSWMPDMEAVSFAESMLNLGFTTRNPIVREAVMKMWEEQALPSLMKPRNAKFSDPFIMPDLKSENPVSIDIFGHIAEAADLTKPVAQARIQLGETLIGEDAKYIPVHSVNELVFSFRANDIDYIVKHNNKDNTFKFYTPAGEYVEAGYQTNIRNAAGEKIELSLLNSKTDQIPESIRNVIHQIDIKLKMGRSEETDVPSVYGSETNVPSLYGIQRYLEFMSEVSINHALGKMKVAINQHKIHLIKQVERGPRKGASDFIPVRLRFRSRDERATSIGTMEGMNSLDVRSNLQADHDGDRARSTHDFSRVDGKELKWGFLKNSFKLSSNNEEYNILEPGVRKANLWGTGFDAKGDLMHAGSRVTDNIHNLKADILADQRAVGKVIGMQSAIEWASLGGLSIGNQNINTKLGYDVDNLVANGDLFRRLEKGNQSIVDFIKNLDPTMRERPYDYMLLAEKEPELMTKLMDFDVGSIEADILYQVMDVMRRPSSIFNNQFSEMGGKQSTAYDIHSHYVRMRKFFNDPNSYIFRTLVRKFQNADVDMTAKLNELIPLFFKTTDDKTPMARDVMGLKKLVLEGKATPTNNVIKFTEKNLDKLMKLSNAGLVMDGVVQNSMFRTEEMDLAWSHHKDISEMKIKSETFLDQLSLMKVIGISHEEMIIHHEKIFDVGKNQYLRMDENAALLYDLILQEEGFLANKLEYQLGFKNGNTSVISGIVNRMDNAAAARNIIESIRGQETLKIIRGEKGEDGAFGAQKKYTVNKKKAGFINNPTDKPQTLYKIVGNLYSKDGTPNWDAVKYVETIRANGRSSQKQSGKFLVLKNPIVGHRVSRESTLEGYTWHYVHNSTPMFASKKAFDRYDADSQEVAQRLVGVWGRALYRWRSNKADFSPFSKASNENTLLLENYFKKSYSQEGEPKVLDQYQLGDFGEDKAFIYYKAKMLLRSNVVPRHFIKGDTELPYMALNNKIFKEVFTWLNNNGHMDVASEIAGEYNRIKNYFAGYSNDMTFDLRPSPLYQTKYNLDPVKANNVLRSVLDGVITPDMEIKLQGMGIGTYRGEVTKVKEGEYQIREVRNMFSNWKENRIDKRKTCKGGL